MTEQNGWTKFGIFFGTELVDIRDMKEEADELVKDFGKGHSVVELAESEWRKLVE